MLQKWHYRRIKSTSNSDKEGANEMLARALKDWKEKEQGGLLALSVVAVDLNSLDPQIASFLQFATLPKAHQYTCLLSHLISTAIALAAVPSLSFRNFDQFEPLFARSQDQNQD
jgi:hypothetical protein